MAKFFVVIGAFLFLSSPGWGQPKQEVVATVDGRPISRSAFDRALRRNMLVVSKKPISKKEVLNDLINRQLGIIKAQKTKLAKKPEVEEKILDLLYHAQISRDLEGAFKKIKVNDQDVKDYYKGHKEVRTRHILFRLRINPSEEEIKAALDQAFEVRKALSKDPSQFPELANKYSQSSTAASGGDMGFQPAARYAPEYYRAIHNKPVGYMTGPVRTQYGYHIIEVLGIRAYEEVSFPLYQKLVYDEKRDRIIDNYFAQLRSKAKVEIKTKNL